MASSPQVFDPSSVSAGSAPPSLSTPSIEAYEQELTRLSSLLQPLENIPRAAQLLAQIDGLYRNLRAANPGSDELDRRKMEAFVDERLRGIPGFDVKLGGAFEWTRGVVEKVRGQIEGRGWRGSPRIPVEAFSSGRVQIRKGEVDSILPSDSLAALIRELEDEITHSLFRRGLARPDLARLANMGAHVKPETPLEKLKNLVRTEDALVAAEAFDAASVDFEALVARAADQPIRPRDDVSVYSNLVREYGKDVLRNDARNVADKLGDAGFQLLTTPAYLSFKGGNAANLLKDMGQPMVQGGLAYALSLQPEVSGDWWKGFVDVLRDTTAAYVDDESSPIHMLRVAQVKKVVESSTKEEQREIFEGLSKMYHTAFAVDPFVRKLMTALFYVKDPEATYAFMDAMVGRATDEWWNSHYFTVPSGMQKDTIQQMMTPEFYVGMAELHKNTEFSGIVGPRQAVNATASFKESIQDAITQEGGVVELTSVEDALGQLKTALREHQEQAQATRLEFEKALSGSKSPLSRMLLANIRESPPAHIPTLQSAYRFADTLLGEGVPETWNETVGRAFGASGIDFNEWKDGDVAAWVTGIYANFIKLEVQKPIRVIPVFTLRKVKNNGKELFDDIPEFKKKFSDLSIPLGGDRSINLTPYMWLKLTEGKGPGPYEEYERIMDADLTVLKTAEPLTDTVYAAYGYSGSGKTWGLLGDAHKKGTWGGLVQRIQDQFDPSTVEVREVRTTKDGDIEVFEKVGTTFDVGTHIKELETRGSIMATPNNPDSSRSFVGVTFRNKTGKSVTVVDMPGMEDFEAMWSAVTAEGDDSACEIWEGTLSTTHRAQNSSIKSIWTHKVQVSLVGTKLMISGIDGSSWIKDGQSQAKAVGINSLGLFDLTNAKSIDVKEWQAGLTAKNFYPDGEMTKINDEKNTMEKIRKVENSAAPVTITLERGLSNLPIAVGEGKRGISVTWAKAWGMRPVGEKMVEKGKEAPPMKYFIQRDSLNNMKRLLEMQSQFINRTLEEFKGLTSGMARAGSAGGKEYAFAASVLFRPPKAEGLSSDWEPLKNPPMKISPSGLKINLFTTMRPDRDIEKTAQFAKETMEDTVMRGGADVARLLDTAWMRSLRRGSKGRRLVLRRKAKINVDVTAA